MKKIKAHHAKHVDFPPAIDIKWTEKLDAGGSFNLPSPAQLIYLPPLVFWRGQKEEGKVQGQLNHTDSSQYIRDLKSQIAELKHEVSGGGNAGSPLFGCVTCH